MFKCNGYRFLKNNKTKKKKKTGKEDLIQLQIKKKTDILNENNVILLGVNFRSNRNILVQFVCKYKKVHEEKNNTFIWF